MTVTLMGSRPVIEAGSFIMGDGSNSAIVTVQGLAFTFGAFLTGEPPTGRYDITGPSSGRFTFVGALNQHGYFWRFLRVGSIAGREFDLLTQISCIASQLGSPSSFKITYTFVEAAPEPAPVPSQWLLPPVES